MVDREYLSTIFVHFRPLEVKSPVWIMFVFLLSGLYLLPALADHRQTAQRQQ